MSDALVIPSLGGPHLEPCLRAVSRLAPAADRVLVVLSGPASAHVDVPAGVDILRSSATLGFADAVNLGLDAVLTGSRHVALLNDDALPAPGWLGALLEPLTAGPDLAAVQGTVTDGDGRRVDGRGITLDRWLLPVQVDRGLDAAVEPTATRPLLAVSATAAAFRSEALTAAALGDGSIFDPRHGSYHEDLDLGLRWRRLGWRAAWVPGALCRHLGSATGAGFRWRHPWWLLANRWRTLAANLTRSALVAALPRALRGELRAVHTLARDNPRALAVAAAVLLRLPQLVYAGWRRDSPGPRLPSLPVDST